MVAAYAVRSVISERSHRVKVVAGGRDAIRVWVNPKVNEEPVLKVRISDPERSASGEALLLAGQNSLVVEVSQLVWDWGFYLRLEDENGRKLRLTDEGRLEALEPGDGQRVVPSPARSGTVRSTPSSEAGPR